MQEHDPLLGSTHGRGTHWHLDKRLHVEEVDSALRTHASLAQVTHAPGSGGDGDGIAPGGKPASGIENSVRLPTLGLLVPVYATVGLPPGLLCRTPALVTPARLPWRGCWERTQASIATICGPHQGGQEVRGENNSVQAR